MRSKHWFADRSKHWFAAATVWLAGVALILSPLGFHWG
jgi:hypothetical protein